MLVGPDVVKRGATMAMRRRAKNRSGEDVYGVPVPEGLHEAIETERDNLSKAESVLGCLATSLEYEADSVNKAIDQRLGVARTATTPIAE
jgi:hypothetical protein